VNKLGIVIEKMREKKIYSIIQCRMKYKEKNNEKQMKMRED
jgi:hypothetical protein